MKRSQLIRDMDRELLKTRALFSVGDTVKLQVKIAEEEGKERLQAFTGLIIAKKGSGLSETFTLYRNAYGCNMEMVFMLHSPRLASVEVERRGRVRRAKLYYIRGKSGKSSKVAEKIGFKPEDISVGETAVKECLTPEMPAQ